jgi:SAM-dependent methyltransferase
MHDTVLTWMKYAIGEKDVKGKCVLEVGSYNVNGSPRQLIMSLGPSAYLGVDMSPGPGVDRVVDAGKLLSTLGPESFDVVISTEMLEHVKDWRLVVNNLKAVLRPQGVMVLTARGPGMAYHGHPDDYWRFTLADARRIFADMEILSLAPDWHESNPGIFVFSRKPSFFNRVDLGAIEVGRAPEK